MFLEFPPFWVAVINILGVPLVHLGSSWFMTRLPVRLFDHPLPILERFPGESRQLYERTFAIKKWKDSLPDAGAWFGGMAKKQLSRTTVPHLSRFRAETRRSELAHWLQFLLLCGFMIWTPGPWTLIWPLYAFLSNITCILLQRYNRLRLSKVLS